MFETGLEELLLHHSYFCMLFGHISEHFLSFKLEIFIRDRTEIIVVHYYLDFSLLQSLLDVRHPDGGEGSLGEGAGGLGHDAGVAQGPSQQHRPPDQVCGEALVTLSRVHSNHRDVEHLLSLELVKQVHVLDSELLVDSEIGSIGGIDNRIYILKT